MARIFLSHSSQNNTEAIAVRDWLAGAGWDDVFLDLDPERGLKAGERWQEVGVEAAFRLPLGGRGGVSDLVADLDGREYREASSGGSIQQTPLDTFDSGSITGVVLI